MTVPDVRYAALAALGFGLMLVPVFVADPLAPLRVHDTRYHFEQGHFYEERGLVQRAIASYSQVLRSAPYDQKAYAARGALYLATNRLDRAFRDLNMALHLDPSDTRSCGRRAQVLVAMAERQGVQAGHRQLDRAMDDVATALAAEPESPARLVRIKADLLLGRNDAALADLGMLDRDVLTRDDVLGWPGIPEAAELAVLYQTLAAALQAQRDLAGAIAAYGAAIRLGPPNTALHYLRGTARLEAGEPAAAVEDFRAGLALDPDNAAFRFLLQQAEGSSLPAQRSPSADPAAAAEQQRQADALRAQRDLAGAIAAYGAAIRLGPPNTALHYLRGTARLEAGEPGAAAEDFRAGLALDPDNAALRFLLQQAEVAIASSQQTTPAAADPAIAVQR